MMYTEGNIIRFDPFYFKNGNTAKPKYFVILKKIDDIALIASLPTRKDTIPSNVTFQFGCVELPDINLNCFVIPNILEVTDCGRKFDFNTYLYGHQIDDYSIDSLQNMNVNEGADYEIWGQMKSDLFMDLRNCFKNSKSVKWKYRKIF